MSLTIPIWFTLKQKSLFKKRQRPPFSAVSKSSPLLFYKATLARESVRSCKATKDLAALSMLSVKSLNSVWQEVVDETIPPIPIPIPGIFKSKQGTFFHRGGKPGGNVNSGPFSGQKRHCTLGTRF